MTLVRPLVRTLLGGGAGAGPRRLRAIEAQANASPTASQATVPAGRDGLVVWTGNYALHEPHHYLAVNRSGETKLVKANRWRMLPLRAHAGMKFGFGSLNFAGAPRAGHVLAAAAVTLPPSLSIWNVAAQTVAADQCAHPDLWLPDVGGHHVELHRETDWLYFPAHSDPRWVLLRWRDDEDALTPPAVYYIPRGQPLKVLSPFPRVYVATPDGSTIDVVCDGDAGGASRAKWYDDSAFSSTVEVNDLAGLKAALKDSTPGRRIVVAAGTYNLDEGWTAANGYAAVAYMLEAAGAVTIVKGTNACELARDGAAGTSIVKGITFGMAASTSAWIVRSGRWWFESCTWSGTPASQNTLWLNPTTPTGPVQLTLSNCTVTDAAADSTSLTAANALHAESFARQLNCTVVNAGTASNDQCVTAHGRLSWDLFGGRYSYAPAHGSGVCWANGSAGSPPVQPLCHAYLSTVSGRVDGRDYSTYLCDVTVETADSYLIGDSAANRGPQWRVGGRIHHANTTTLQNPIIARWGTIVEAMVVKVDSTHSAPRGLNLRGNVSVEGVLGDCAAGYAIHAGFGTAPDHDCVILNCGSVRDGCVTYNSTNYDYLLTVRNCLAVENAGTNFHVQSSTGTADVTSSHNQSRTNFGANWPGGPAGSTDDAVGAVAVDAATLMPAASAAAVLGTGCSAAQRGYDLGGYDSHGQILHLGAGAADRGPTTRQRVDVDEQWLHPEISIT